MDNVRSLESLRMPKKRCSSAFFSDGHVIGHVGAIFKIVCHGSHRQEVHVLQEGMVVF